MLSPVRLLHGWISQNYFEFSKPEASICIPQPKSNYVHFALNIWHLVATILMIFLRINCPNLGQFDWIIKVFRDLQYRYANAMLPLSLRKVWKVSKLTRPEIHQFIKQFSNVARVDHLYMVDHVKFLMHLRLYGMFQHRQTSCVTWSHMGIMLARTWSCSQSILRVSPS